MINQGHVVFLRVQSVAIVVVVHKNAVQTCGAFLHLLVWRFTNYLKHSLNCTSPLMMVKMLIMMTAHLLYSFVAEAHPSITMRLPAKPFYTHLLQ